MRRVRATVNVRRGMAIGVIAALAGAGGGAGAAHAQESDPIPAWIQTTFIYYANGEITGAELINALEYLISNNIIQVTANAASATAAEPAAPGGQNANATAAPPAANMPDSTVSAAVAKVQNELIDALFNARAAMADAASAIEYAGGHMSGGYFAAAADAMDRVASHVTIGSYHMDRGASASIELAGMLDDAGDATRAAHAHKLAAALDAAAGAAGTAVVQVEAAADAMGAAADRRDARAALNAAESALLPVAKALSTIKNQEYAYIGEPRPMTLGDTLGAYPESAEFKRLYPDHMEDTINAGHPNYQYELRSIDKDGHIFETDALVIEYNDSTGESVITYLCTEADGDRIAYNGDDLAEVMAGICG